MIPVDRSHLFVAANSHPGMSGKNNEDRYAVSAFRLSEQPQLPALLAVVCDGIGGHHAGEVAAELAVDIISQAVGESDASHPVATLREAIIQASQTIVALSDSEDDKKGMGATAVCAWVIQDRLYLAYVGDSRAYLIRNHAIQQISIDHTWVQEAMQAGVLTPEQAKTHPNAHVIRRYLGSRQPVEPDWRLRLRPDESDEQARNNQGLLLKPNDQVILCSDGLTDLVQDSEILSALNKKNQADAIDHLIALANQRGGHDNITIVALRTPARSTQTKPLPGRSTARQESTQTRLRPSWKWAVLAAIIITLLALAAITAGVFFYLQNATPAPTATDTVRPALILPSSTPLDTLEPITPSLPPATLTLDTATPQVATPQNTPTTWPTNTTAP